MSATVEIINTSSARGTYDYGSIVRQVEPLSFYGAGMDTRTPFHKNKSPARILYKQRSLCFKQSKESLGDRLMQPFRSQRDGDVSRLNRARLSTEDEQTGFSRKSLSVQIFLNLPGLN